MWTENQVIEEISRIFTPRPDIAPLGIGDDCAVFRDGLNLITTDAAVEGVHFDLSWMSLADAAYRCTTANLSDVASMGAEPSGFTLALCLRPDLGFESIRDAILAIKQCIADHNLDDCWLIGGDVVRSSVVSFSITMLGKKPNYPVLRRCGASDGDVIAVLGNIGHSAAGLELCRRNLMFADAISTYKPYLDAFKRPKALCHVGIAIAKERLAHAMMDVSDGIMTDLGRMLESSHCGGIVDVGVLKPTESMSALARELLVQPRGWMLCGGEDFSLLVAIPKSNVDAVKSICQQHKVDYTQLGHCHKNINGIRWMDGRDEVHLKNTSFVHFA